MQPARLSRITATTFLTVRTGWPEVAGAARSLSPSGHEELMLVHVEIPRRKLTMA